MRLRARTISRNNEKTSMDVIALRDSSCIQYVSTKCNVCGEGVGGGVHVCVCCAADSKPTSRVLI